jgi:hypothetical protein
VDEAATPPAVEPVYGSDHAPTDAGAASPDTPDAAAAPVDTSQVPADVPADVYTCDQCGTRYGGPGTCVNGHPATDVVPLREALAAGIAAQPPAPEPEPEPEPEPDAAPPADPDAPKAPPPLTADQAASLPSVPGAAGAPSVAAQVGAILANVRAELDTIASLTERV